MYFCQKKGYRSGVLKSYKFQKSLNRCLM
ncbi:hypothetical protein FAE02_000614 [Enterococcus faecium]|nr:hypothetical protein [Enterococcus faecium]MBX4241779.1 hypothetical protein [Enterococcus lactis]UDP42446.1 hypothetical protein L234_03410 [Enterococcus faecium UC7251]EGP4969270.1 hypothetical protein [Enterococcus faecium]EGP5037182.1 hypothetical protein [Enterococcus faecium]